MAEDLDFEAFTELPGYKSILKAVLKSQIQMLVQQLAKHTGEESVLLSASISDGTFSHLGSDFGKDFIRGHDEFKAKFLGFCLEKHHKRKLEDRPMSMSKRFASASQVHNRPKGHIAETISTSPIPHANPLSGIRSSSLVPKSKKHKHITVTASEEYSPSSGIYRREITGGSQSINPSKSESSLPYSSDNQRSDRYTIKMEDEIEKADKYPIETEDMNERQAVFEEDRNTLLSQNQGSENLQPMTNSSFDYVLDQDRETETSPLPWQLNGVGNSDRQPVSKRKQYMPIRHTQNISELSGYLCDSETGFSSNKSSLLKDDRNNTRSSSPVLFCGIDTKKIPREREEYGYSPMTDMTFGELGELNLSGAKYTEMETSKYGSPSMEGGKKAPQIDGLLVSRGEGRYEKLIKCDICGKVCRTSNMARHKKRYCLGYQSTGPMKIDRPSTIVKFDQMDTKFDLDLTDVGSSSSV